MKPTLILALTTFSILALSVLSAQSANGWVLKVQGRGEVQADPDQAQLTLGVSELAPTALQAQNQVNLVIARILSELAQVGIDAKDIQTQGFNLIPVYSRTDRGEPASVNAYRAVNTLTIAIRELDQVGAVIDRATSAGANEIQGVSFSLANDEEAKARALAIAAQDARKKAQVLADSFEVRLLHILEITESSDNIRPVFQTGVAYARESSMAPASVSPGQVTASASVSVSYQIGIKP